MKIHLNYFTGSLFALALFTFTVNAEATNYYIDATSGNDSYNGMSPTTAWKTLSKLNSITLYAGDVVALKRGEVWRESLPVNNSGTDGNYIKYTSYGTGAKPKIIGSVSELTGWTLYSGNIWQKSLATEPAQITFTKGGVDNFGYEQTGITNCNADYKYYWASNVLYVYATSDPNGYYSAIERHSLASGAIFSADYIWLDGLEIAYFTNRGIRTNQADYAKITYCKIHHIASGGFDSNGEGIYNLSSYVLISHNEIYECSVHGIYNGSYQPYKSNFDTVEYNRVYNCYHTGIDNMNVDWTTYVGGNVIRYNVVFDSSAQGGGAVSPDYGSSGIQVMGHYQAGTAAHWFSNAKIYGNIVYGNAVVGLNIVEFSDSVYIYNNTLYYNNSQGILIRDKNPKAGDGEQDHPKYLWMYNNISSSSGYQDIQIDSLTNKSIDYNVYYSERFAYFGQAKGTNYSSLSSWQTATGFDANSYLNDPLFTNTSTYDFTLQSSSPAIDAGTNLVNSSPYFWTEDIEGTSTPQNSITDIGVYEKIQGGGGNNPPYQPSNPVPENGAVNQSVNTTLAWSCSDPNGDPLTYDVYFGTVNNPPLAAGNRTSANYNPGQLNNNATYYWKIVAKDNQGASTAGPLWSFSTEASGSTNDVIPPELVVVQSVQPDEVVLDFSEPLDTASARSPSNYIISDQVQVLSALLSQSHERVILTTSQQIINHIYTIEITNVTDTAGNVISSQANSKFYKILDIGSTGYIEHLINNVSASATTDTNTSPQKTLDGLVNGDPDPNSRWAAQVMPQWIQYDLGTVETVSLIAVSFYEWNAGRIYQYSIQTSDDEVQWNEVVSNAASSSQEWTFNEFTDLSARYVRIICLSNNQADWAGVWETRIFEPDGPTAVNFSLFTASLDDENHVVLNWTTSTEQNCREFNVTRREGNNNFNSIGTVPGHGSVTEPHNYTFTDNTVKGGSYSYRLEEVDFEGNIHYSNIVEIEVDKLQKFTLEQNYPNPFNPSTKIDFSIPIESQVTLKVYDILGNEIKTLVKEKKPQGFYEVEFNGSNLPSGIYLVKMQASSYIAVKKMILLK